MEGNLLKGKFFMIVFIMTTFILAQPVLANQNVDWKFFKTDNFMIIYHPEVIDQAYYIALTAEEVFADLSKFTGFKPYRKIAIIVTGQDDFANGFAKPLDVIRIIVNPAYLSTRVDQDWLKNVITHELTHLVQMEATFEPTHILHKITGMSTPFGVTPNTLHPTWFLEGIAQYGSTRQGYDGIDRKRQMIFEQKIHNDKFYTNAEIIWGRSALDGEAYYSYGFGFFEFLMRNYGEEKLLKLQKIHNYSYLLGTENTIHMVYKKTLNVLLNEWKEELHQRFPIRKDRVFVAPIIAKPELSEWKESLATPDGGVIFAESNINYPSSQIKSWHPDQGLTTLLDNPKLAFTRLALSPNGDTVLFTGYEVKNKNIRFDLYELNLNNKKITRLSKDQRIIQGVYFKDGYLVVKNDWGKNHLYYLANNQLTQLTDTNYNFNITDLAVSPNQKRVAINFNYDGKRGIAVLSTDSWSFEKIYIPKEGLDWILGDFINDNEITLSWDRLEHYDLYNLNVETNLCQRITNTREDILQGQVKSVNDQLIWIGQIYGSTGFTIASDQLFEGETIAIKTEDVVFTSPTKPEIKTLDTSDYNHLSQLRSLALFPFLNIETIDHKKEPFIGITQVLQDPLDELQFSYQLAWNLNMKTFLPHLKLETTWKGSNPELGLNLQTNNSKLQATFTQSYDKFPYFINGSENITYSDNFRFDELKLQFGRIWLTNKPGSTMIETKYYPATPNTKVGYSVLLKNQQNIPLGYNANTLTTQTLVGYAGGSSYFTWGQDGMMRVYPEKSSTNKFIFEKITYKHNLIDLSYDLMSLIQTGRLYGNIYGEIGIFDNHAKKITSAHMIGAEVILESSIFNLIPLDLDIGVASNLQDGLELYYNIGSPF